MGINALTHRDDGTKAALPVSSDDWKHWVSAGRTRNWMLDDPLIDWLQLYGKSRDYIPKQELADYNKALDFVEFIFGKGNEFEAGILRLLQEQYEVATIAGDYREISRLDKAEGTFEAMKRGTPIIYQAVLRDAHNMTYGSPDFLVRSDVLRRLFPQSIGDLEASAPAPDLEADGWHYIVVDTKFTTLHLNAAGTELANDGSVPAYKAQLYIYNRMLGRLQGFEPPQAYVLGRGWQGLNARKRFEAPAQWSYWDRYRNTAPSLTELASRMPWKRPFAGCVGYASRVGTGSFSRSRRCRSFTQI